MYISPVSLQNNYHTQNKVNNQPAFMGITKVMSRSIGIDGKKDVLEILSKRPGKNTRVGQLPNFIFERIPKDANKGAVINEFFTAFENCAEEIRNFKPSWAANPADEVINRRPQLAVDKLKAVFMKYNMLEDPDKFNLKFIGAGEYKKAYKLEGVKDNKTNEEFCFKVFHLVDKTPEWHKYKCHGNYAEINISSYWRKNVGAYTQRNKFYFGDVNNGYLVDRYITPDAAAPQKIIDEYDYGVKIVDEVEGAIGHNKIAGHSIDEGGSRVLNRVKNQSKTARYVLKLIKETPEADRYAKWFRILDEYNHLDNVQKKAGLALSIKHMPNKLQEELMMKCIGWNIPLVDQSLAYALKYLPFEKVPKFFDALMRRENPTTQTVVLNEIPLLSKFTIPGMKYDDIDTARSEIDPDMIKMYFNMAAKSILPEVEEHLASYIHLLPKDEILPYAKILINKHNPHIEDRLLHKAKFVSNDQYSLSDKMEIIDLVRRNTRSDFVKQKADEVKVRLIRESLSDD